MCSAIAMLLLAAFERFMNCYTVPICQIALTLASRHSLDSINLVYHDTGADPEEAMKTIASKKYMLAVNSRMRYNVN